MSHINYPASFIDYCETLKMKLTHMKLTSLRKEVLYVLWCATKPLKAYDILEHLLKTKSNSTPPTVYRALVFFVSVGLVHKIESIQCYTLCHEPQKQLSSEVLMVCGECLQVIEMHHEGLSAMFLSLAQDHGFYLGHDAIELRGRCRACKII